MADSNNEAMDKVYYYSRMTKQCIEKTIAHIDSHKLFPDLDSTANIFNMSDDESNEEESSSNDYTEYLENFSFFISNLWSFGADS